MLISHALIGLLVFLLLNCKCSLYILDTRPFSDISFVNSSSFCKLFFSLRIVSFDARKSFEMKKYKSFNFVLLFQDRVDYSMCLEFSYECMSSFTTFTKSHWDFASY